jgi:DNA-binding transcriptional LysR family regulator
MNESVDRLDWDGLRVLRVVAQEGSIRRAAARVGLSQPTLGRRLRALEGEMGVPLLVRHARGIELTTEGRAALEAANAMHTRFESLRRGLSGRRAAVEGRVRISCTEPVAMSLLPASLAALRDAHPGLRIDLVADAMASDLDRREADLAIRMFQPRRANLVARRVGTTHTAFYASRAYIARRGRPESLADLLEHEVIGPDRVQVFVRAASEMGFDLDRVPYRTDALATSLAWVRAGLAIGALLAVAADDDPDLVEVLPPIQEHPVWLVSHPDLFGSAAVRAVWDRLAEDLSARLAASG